MLKPLKIPFDSLTLRAVVAELRPVLLGGQVQDIRQPERTDLLIGIRSHGRNLWLVLSDAAQFARVHLTTTKRPNAPSPPAFCMALRKYLEGGILLDVRQRGFDRIFEMEVGRRDEEGEQVTHTLIAELMGKHSNLILVNEAGLIVDSAKRITHRVNRLRETLPGLPYQPPPEQADRIAPFQPGAFLTVLDGLTEGALTAPDVLTDALLNAVAGMSPFLAREITERTFAGKTEGERGVLLRKAWQEMVGGAGQERFAPTAVLYRAAVGAAYPFPIVQAPAEQQKPVPELNAALDSAFTTNIAKARFEAGAGELRGKIERERKRVEKQRQSVARTLQEVERAEAYRQTGELILTNLWQIAPEAASVTVQDYFDPAYPDRDLALDPKLTPQENAELWFRRYRKARDAQEQAQEQSQRWTQAFQALTAAQERLQALQPETPGAVEALAEMRDELTRNGLLRQVESDRDEPTGPDFQGHKIRRYTTPEGYEIYVGETATANDFLTTRLASPNDLWMHVRASTGSHVVIRTKGQPDAVPKSVIQQAAILCARHSSQKHSSLVPVDYTLKKFVRKPRGAAAGSADYQRETTLHVTP